MLSWILSRVKAQHIVIAVSLFVAFAGGFWCKTLLAPPKLSEQTSSEKSVDSKKVVTKKQTRKDIVTETRPDGTTIVTDKSVTEQDVVADVKKESSKEAAKIVYDKKKYSVQLYGISGQLLNPQPYIGGSIGMDVFGPFSVHVFGTSRLDVGVGLGFRF